MKDYLNRSFPSPVFTLPFSLVFAPFIFPFIENLQRKSPAGSSFIERIFHVLSMRTHPEMFRIYASWIVASVADAFAFWNWAFEFLKDNAVSEARSIAFVFPRHLPIAFVIQRTSVVPAAGRKIDFNLENNSLPRKEGFYNS